MKLKIKKLHPEAIIPTRGSKEASGLDLYALETVYIGPNQRKLVKTGIAFGIPIGYEIQVRPRSGNSLKTPMIIPNSPGTLDQDFVGEVCIIIWNSSDETYVIAKGDRIAQAVLCPVVLPELEEVEELSSTERGSGGFGSSGA